MDSSSSPQPKTPRSSGWLKRIGEEEYVGLLPHLASPASPESPPKSLPKSYPESPPQLERSKRNGGTSDENQMSSQPEHSKRNGGTSDESQMSSQVHSITVEEYRISGPVYLPIPVRYNGLAGQRYRDAWDAGLESDIRQILRNHNILRAVANLDRRRTEHIQAAPRSADYIFIEVAEPSEGGEWLRAVNEILDSCRHRGLDGLNVEIADPRGLVPRISATISSTLPIVREWERVLLPDILQALSSNVEWLTIDLVNRAPGTNFGSVGKTSFIPTILIMIQENTKESYTAARAKIRSLLDPRFPEVAVEVIRGSLDVCVGVGVNEWAPVFEHHDDKLWQDEGYMGASIQRAGIGSSGTLGCFIKLRHPSCGWSTYGLTNFHVVMPDHDDYAHHDSQTLSWIQYGLRPGFATTFQINMPSEIDLDAARINYVQTIQEIEGDVLEGMPPNELFLTYRELEAQGLNPEEYMPWGDARRVRIMIGRVTTSRERINAIDGRRNNMRLGVVYAGSGIRRLRSQQIMDWALIRVDNARVPARNELPINIDKIYMTHSQMNRIGSLALSQEVFKIGRRSNRTRGYVNPVKTTMLLAWANENGIMRRDYGKAWTVVDRKVEDEEGKENKGTKCFSDKGDSGSAVFTKAGEFVGLLHAGVQPYRDITYVTSAQDLVEDIKHITGAVEVTML
jgi:hypothetical protein